MSNYQQLTYEQRCQIFVLKKIGYSQRAIARSIGTSQSIICSELGRNAGERGYRHKQAQARSVGRHKGAIRRQKMTSAMISVIESKLRLDWSPEQISGWLLDDRQLLISHETIYLHVWSDKRFGDDLYKHLRRQGKKYDKRRNGKPTRGQIKGRVSIDERAHIEDEKSRIGGWEIDTLIGKGHSGVLVTIVERVTKFTLSAQVDNKSAAAVTKATISLLKPFKYVVHSITADNGKEFAYHVEVTKALSADVYFAPPYSSWERGLNENTNGLLRQYFPKSTNLKLVSTAEVNKAVRRLNARPRKALGFKTPDQLMGDYRAAIAA
jgi:IS30 family transposase